MAKETKPQGIKGFFSRIKLTDSYTSLVFGVIFVLIAGILFFAFVRGNRNPQTSSTTEEGSDTSSTYTVKAGDDLWSISEQVYDDGYQWTKIALENKLDNPGTIFEGSKLIIPTLTPEEKELAVERNKIQEATPSSAIEGVSIEGDTYKIVEGDNLWDISVRAYGDGYKWVELAEINKIENPNLIYPDNVLNLPR